MKNYRNSFSGFRQKKNSNLEKKEKKMKKSEFAKEGGDFSSKKTTFHINNQEITRKNLEKQKNFIKKNYLKVIQKFMN